ncbi:MAG: iron chelate uptake ABC transporter family permease subunit, partial [Stackebrandtia sp.]
MRAATATRTRLLLVGGLAVAVLTVVAAVHLSQGAAEELTASVLWGSRVPRTLAGVVAGVGLGVSGALIQGATR